MADPTIGAKNNTENLDGYLMVSKLDSISSKAGESSYLHLVNKFDYLSNGKSKTGYHTLKDKYLLEKPNVDIHTVNYGEALDAYKTTESAEDFVKLLLPNLF